MNFLELFFKRKGNVDDLRSFPNWRVGLSSAADWSWGVSMAVGIGIMKSKGVCPFLFWMAGNILAIPLIGIVRRYLPDSRNWPRFTPLLLIFLMIEYFAICINMSAILAGFGGGTDVSSYQIISKDFAIIVVVLYTLFIAWYVNKGGLKIIMLTDLGCYTVQMLSAIFIAGASYYFSGGVNNIQWINSPGAMEWARIAFIGIITGALSAGHQWQKYTAIEEKNIFNVTMWGGFFFAIYGVFIFFSGLYFTKNIVLGWSFLVIMVALATSTIDSAISGMGYVLQKFGFKSAYLGTAISVFVILTWPLIDISSITNTWTTMAKIRYPVILFFIFATLLTVIIKPLKNEKLENFLKLVKIMK